MFVFKRSGRWGASMTDPMWDPLGEARQALEFAVAEHGVEVLEQSSLLENVLRDQLPNMPPAAALAVAACRSGVADLITARLAEGFDGASALSLAKTAFAERTGIDLR